uniref:Uncharacterized protein n=1 Tax=Anopheles farauti TaxID=69004 RepID=A0A182QFE7_9DIPT
MAPDSEAQHQITAASSETNESTKHGNRCQANNREEGVDGIRQVSQGLHTRRKTDGASTRSEELGTTALGDKCKRKYPERYKSLTDYKQANFGSKLAVEKSYNAYSNTNFGRQQAMSHLQRVNVEGRCKVPKPKLVPASSDRTKVYIPHCTILHRCEEDTGCCMPLETCAPKSTTNVTLYFYVSNETSMDNVGVARQQHTVTTLTFSNHTECHCVRLDTTLHNDPRRGSRSRHHNAQEHSSEGSGGSSGSYAPATTGSSCMCPRHYTSVNDNESNCFCDCLSHDRDCIRFKEGFESFSIETRNVEKTLRISEASQHDLSRKLPNLRPTAKVSNTLPKLQHPIGQRYTSFYTQLGPTGGNRVLLEIRLQHAPLTPAGFVEQLVRCTRQHPEQTVTVGSYAFEHGVVGANLRQQSITHGRPVCTGTHNPERVLVVQLKCATLDKFPGRRIVPLLILRHNQTMKTVIEAYVGAFHVRTATLAALGGRFVSFLYEQLLQPVRKQTLC